MVGHGQRKKNIDFGRDSDSSEDSGLLSRFFTMNYCFELPFVYMYKWQFLSPVSIVHYRFVAFLQD